MGIYVVPVYVPPSFPGSEMVVLEEIDGIIIIPIEIIELNEGLGCSHILFYNIDILSKNFQAFPKIGIRCIVIPGEFGIPEGKIIFFVYSRGHIPNGLIHIVLVVKSGEGQISPNHGNVIICLLYTSDAAD